MAPKYLPENMQTIPTMSPQSETITPSMNFLLNVKETYTVYILTLN